MVSLHGCRSANVLPHCGFAVKRKERTGGEWIQGRAAGYALFSLVYLADPVPGAWSAFRTDIIWLLPARWSSMPKDSTGPRHPIETAEEHEGMLSGQVVEMSERPAR